ncbi:unnamed protein product [Malus baccata var. baccata]
MAQVLQLSLLYVAAVAFMFQQCCGWSLGDKVLHWYNPINPKKWVSNAVSSLGSIITTYHLDGIDIDYENFPNPKRSNSLSSFAFCIGELITGLKNKGLISVASIAPFYSTTAPYVQLFDGYAHVIDYVNHQFYTDKVTTTKGYLQAFKLRAAQFGKEKFLPAYEVDGRGIQGDAFLDALTLLQTNGFEINGVLIFSADAASKNNFYYERKSQAFLLNSSAPITTRARPFAREGTGPTRRWRFALTSPAFVGTMSGLKPSFKTVVLLLSSPALALLRGKALDLCRCAGLHSLALRLLEP